MTAGEPGVSGARGPTSPPGPKRIRGEPGVVRANYIRLGEKTCPNSEATLIYEGSIKIVHPLKSSVESYRNHFGREEHTEPLKWGLGKRRSFL